MKSLIASFFLLLALPSSFQINLRSPLPSTPKASSLANHNGLSPNNSPYGPPAYFSAENLRVENADGSYFALEDNGFKNASIGDGSKCDITQQAFYRICEAISDCGLCAAMENCGWCQSSGRCLPGNIDGCFCKDDCPNDYYNSKLKCPSQVTGDFGHIDPTAKKLIDPEISLPKIAITQTTISQKLTENPIVIGSKQKTREVQAIEKESGMIVNQEITYNEKIMGTIKLPEIDVKSETKIMDPVTNKEVVRNTTLGYFGTDKK